MHRSASSLFLLTSVFVAASLYGSDEADAQIQLDRFFPPSVGIGTTSEITAEGKFPSWPVTAVSGRQDVKVTAREDSGKLSVTVAADAPPGLSWIRVHDEDDASALVPLLIEPQSTSVESEPNNEIQAANSLSLPAIVGGRLHRRNEIDTYAVDLQKDQTLIVSAIANRLLKSPMDAVLQIVDPHGNVRLQNDDSRGLDPLLVYRAPEDERCFIRLFAFPETPNSTIGYAGDTSFVYQLRLTTGSYLDHVTPLLVGTAHAEMSGASTDPLLTAGGWNLPSDVRVKTTFNPHSNSIISYAPKVMGWQRHGRVAGNPQLLREGAKVPATADRLPVVFAGQIDRPKEIDRLLITVEKNKRYRATVHSQKFGLSVDSVLRFVDPNDGKELARNDDTGRHEYDASVTYQAKIDGPIELQISDLVDGFGPLHAYTIVVEEIQPTVSLTLDRDHLLLPTEGESEVTIAIDRQDGFDARLRITADGLPEGVTASSVISEPKGDSAKRVKLQLKADAKARHQGVIRLVASAIDDEGTPTGSKSPVRFVLSETESVESIWLTVAAKKE